MWLLGKEVTAKKNYAIQQPPQSSPKHDGAEHHQQPAPRFIQPFPCVFTLRPKHPHFDLLESNAVYFFLIILAFAFADNSP